MQLLLTSSSLPALQLPSAALAKARVRVAASAAASAPDGAGAAASGTSAGRFPVFLPQAVERIRDGAAVRLAKRIERVPVQFWKSYIKRPMVLVGPSLGAAVAIDFSINYPEAVSKMIFIGASVYSEGPKDMTRMPKFVSYAGVFILKSLPLRFLATRLAFNKVPTEFFDWVQIGRLHCLLPWWEDATVDFMIRGGYNVINQIKQVKHKCLILWGEDDGIISSKLGYRLHQELPDAILRQIRQCGHIPHVEKPREAVKHVLEFLARNKSKGSNRAPSVPSVPV